MKEKVFIKSDTLSINRMMLIGYLACLHPQHTNKATLKELLNITFKNVHLNLTLAAELDLTLKPIQTAAAAHGDVFVSSPPPFELYKTKKSPTVRRKKSLNRDHWNQVYSGQRPSPQRILCTTRISGELLEIDWFLYPHCSSAYPWHSKLFYINQQEQSLH